MAGTARDVGLLATAISVAAVLALPSGLAWGTATVNGQDGAIFQYTISPAAVSITTLDPGRPDERVAQGPLPLEACPLPVCVAAASRASTAVLLARAAAVSGLVGILVMLRCPMGGPSTVAVAAAASSAIACACSVGAVVVFLLLGCRSEAAGVAGPAVGLSMGGFLLLSAATSHAISHFLVARLPLPPAPRRPRHKFTAPVRHPVSSRPVTLAAPLIAPLFFEPGDSPAPAGFGPPPKRRAPVAPETDAAPAKRRGPVAPSDEEKGNKAAAMLEPEVIVFEGPPSWTELVIPTLSILTVIGIVPFLATLARQFWVKYKFTSLRVSVTSGFGGNQVSEIVYAEVSEARYVLRAFGGAGDLVLFLRDGARLEMKSVPQIKMIYEDIMSRIDDEARENSFPIPERGD